MCFEAHLLGKQALKLSFRSLLPLLSVEQAMVTLSTFFVAFPQDGEKKALLWPFFFIRSFGSKQMVKEGINICSSQFLSTENIGYSERCHSHPPVSSWAPESCSF